MSDLYAIWVLVGVAIIIALLVALAAITIYRGMVRRERKKDE